MRAYRPRCSHYLGVGTWRDRCLADADVRLIDEGGAWIPGGGYCAAHAEETIAEIARARGVAWSVGAVYAH